MAPLHSQACEGAAYPRLDTRLQSPKKTIINWFLFLFPPTASLRRLPPKILPFRVSGWRPHSHLCRKAGGRQEGARGQALGSARPRGGHLPAVGRGQGGGRPGGAKRKCPPKAFVARFESLENRGTSENMGATQVAQWHGSALGAEFDHSPLAPPIVHPSHGVNHCRTSSVSRHPRIRVGTA